MDGIRWVFHASGLAWFTPLVGKQDRADLEYLRAAILRDYHWLRALRAADTSAGPLARVEADLGALVGAPRSSGTSSEYAPIVYPWHVISGWTHYGAIRLEMLALLPEHARLGALTELARMAPLVLPGSRDGWTAELNAATQVALDNSGDASLPHRIQALWREVDFGRNYWRARVAKNTTITTLLWSLLVVSVIGMVISIASLDTQSPPSGKPTSGETATSPPETASTTPTAPDLPNVWLVALLGLFGGTISALRSTDMLAMPERRSLEVEAVRLRLRPVVGAAMAVVVYVIGRSEIVFQLTASAADQTTVPTHQAPIQIHVPVIAWGYYALAFVAGFSERWFLKIIELVDARADRPAPPVSKPTGKEGDGSSSTGGGGSTSGSTTTSGTGTNAAKTDEVSPPK